jgi:hypothetical protein
VSIGSIPRVKLPLGVFLSSLSFSCDLMARCFFSSSLVEC